MINRKRTLSLEGNYQGKTVYMDIFSSRNRVISKYSDVSPYAVGDYGSIQNEQVSNDKEEETEEKREIWYPVVDIVLDDSMCGVAAVAGSGRFQMNQTPAEELDGEKEIEYSREKLEDWENNFLASGSAALKNFWIRKRCTVSGGRVEEAVRFLSDDWEGEIEFWAEDSGAREVLYRESVKLKGNRLSENPGESPDDRYWNALRASVDYILKSQVQKKDSIYYQGLHLFYDHDAKTFRQPSWVWTWGPAISALLDAAEMPEVTKVYPRETLYQAAGEIGEATLRFQLKDPDSPAYGLVYCRRDYNLKIKRGYMEFLSPPDSLFMAGWGWMPLYAKTGEKKYLEATKLMVEQTWRILQTNDDIIEQDYMMPDNKWKDWILDEAGFGMKAFAELYKAEPDEKYRQWGKIYIDQILNCFEREDGLWDRMWTRSTKTVWEISYYTRAMGWAMEGLLSSYQLLEDKVYLQKAEKMARAMMSYQNEDGSWYFKFDRGAEHTGISEKGTAYWSGLLYRLYDATQNPEYREAARKALDWCVENQYLGEDSDGWGGIIGRTPSSGIIYRRFFDLSCTYTSAFFADALVRGWKHRK